MVFSFFTKQKQDESLTLLVDIGSASVGAALVKIEEGKPPHILLTVREDISFQETLSSARFLSGMLHALERSLKNLQKLNKGHGAPAHTFCTFSSPWFVLKSRKLHITRTDPFQVTEKTLDAFINEDIEHLKDELKETLPLVDIEIIEKKIIEIRLNGYEIKNPYGQTTHQMEILATVGLSSKRVIESVENIISRFFHAPSVHFGSFPVAAFSAVRDIFPNEKNFLFLDITGETTDVSLVVDDLLVGVTSFSRGKNFFLREISAGENTLHAEAATLFGMFLRDELEGKKRDTIGNIVARSKDEWAARFEKTLTSFAGTSVIPPRVFFTTDSDVAGFFTGLINTARPESLMGDSLEVAYLDQLIVSKFVTFESEIVRDPFIVVEALLAGKIMMQK
ncbi:MAG: hypothetical protein A2937_03045 [Candidatus Yonathbacteria bacterium RIFCSPLOWO2_01_FULL_47_33b]|uniref:SHS2 domain-containing protein n=1 Tax=Candidatus Yonathbacteria bacterium RIFCSPLOWO2_01_FULL_47_33b TaxID=1802727 RepID=A0A1G2SEB6_9BACT|nr:MAG: hypothetical protein A2937_03045 [Candidatus Yonathbacteria bacterium RIFCSPLOWO2_01_FULL_47_33b]